jgi:hypothetical protein
MEQQIDILIQKHGLPEVLAAIRREVSDEEREVIDCLDKAIEFSLSDNREEHPFSGLMPNGYLANLPSNPVEK